MGNHRCWFVMIKVDDDDWPDLDGPYSSESDALRYCDSVNAVRTRHGWKPATFHLVEMELQTFTTINHKYA